jgi:hypothetical protein
MYLEDLHFGKYFASTCSFLNRTHPFGQTCILSYDILSARRSFSDSYKFYGIMCPTGSMVPHTANILLKPSRLRFNSYFNPIT